VSPPTNLALQVALLITILAGLLGFMISARMMRLPEVKPSGSVEGAGRRPIGHHSGEPVGRDPRRRPIATHGAS
jgi:hypothetical protein